MFYVNEVGFAGLSYCHDVTIVIMDLYRGVVIRLANNTNIHSFTSIYYKSYNSRCAN